MREDQRRGRRHKSRSQISGGEEGRLESRKEARGEMR